MKKRIVLLAIMLACVSVQSGNAGPVAESNLPLPKVPREVVVELGIDDSLAIPEYYSGWYYLPDTLALSKKLGDAIFFAGPLDLGTVLMIDIVTSAQNGCMYCLCAGFILAEGMGVPKETLIVIQGNLPNDQLSEKENALMQLAAVLTTNPESARGAVLHATETGWSDAEVAHAIHVTALMNMNNLMAEGFGYPPDWIHPYDPEATIPIEECGTAQERKVLLDFFGIGDEQ